MISDEIRNLLSAFSDSELASLFAPSTHFVAGSKYPSVRNEKGDTLRILQHQTDAFHPVRGVEPDHSATSVLWGVDGTDNQFFLTYKNDDLPSRDMIADYSWRLLKPLPVLETVSQENVDGTPLDAATLISGWTELEWVQQVDSPTMTLGGNPSQSELFNRNSWPQVDNNGTLLPLVYYGEVFVDGHTLTVFVGTHASLEGKATLAKWEPNQLNAVFVNDVVPEHVTMKPLDGFKVEDLVVVDTHYETASTLPKYPYWVQGEEIPDGTVFVAEIVSGAAEIDEIMFGDMGILYIFVDTLEPDRKACLLYQSY